MPGFSKEWWDSLPQSQRDSLIDIYLHANETHHIKEAEKAPEDAQHRRVMLDMAQM
jgi:hypothetical protein